MHTASFIQGAFAHKLITAHAINIYPPPLAVRECRGRDREEDRDGEEEQRKR